MFHLDGFRPSDRRGFLHKSFIGKFVGGAVKTLVPAVGVASGVLGTARGIFGGRGSGPRPTLPRTATARPTFLGAQGKDFGRELKFGGDAQLPAIFPEFARPRARPLPMQAFAPGVRCDPPNRINPATGRCQRPTGGVRGRAERFLPGGRTGFEDVPSRQFDVGDAVMGQYGAALEPGVMQIERSLCLPGMQLAKDGLCYNKGAITNAQRMWPRGRKPLLTGGDMRAIGIAARAGAKLDRTTKRLRSLGMMKALPRPRAKSKLDTTVQLGPHAHA